MSLTGKTKASSYRDLLQMNNSNGGVDATTRNVVDGYGRPSSISISDDVLLVTPQTDDTTAVFKSTDKDGNALLTVDSNNDVVKAGIGQHIVNTNIKEFALDFNDASPDLADIWHGLISTYNVNTSNELEMGSSSAIPLTSLTIASSATKYAHHVVKHYWYIPVNITIDSCHVLFGQDATGTDNVKFSIMSYDVVTAIGSTSGNLSGGVENCASLAVVPGAGREQVYYQSLQVSTPDVDAGKVILAFVAQDGVNNDLSVNMNIVYHLR